MEVSFTWTPLTHPPTHPSFLPSFPSKASRALAPTWSLPSHMIPFHMTGRLTRWVLPQLKPSCPALFLPPLTTSSPPPPPPHQESFHVQLDPFRHPANVPLLWQPSLCPVNQTLPKVPVGCWLKPSSCPALTAEAPWWLASPHTRHRELCCMCHYSRH